MVPLRRCGHTVPPFQSTRCWPTTLTVTAHIVSYCEQRTELQTHRMLANDGPLVMHISTTHTCRCRILGQRENRGKPQICEKKNCPRDSMFSDIREHLSAYPARSGYQWY